MATLNILTFPCDNNLIVTVGDKFCERVIKIIEGIQNKQNNILEYEEPEIGFYGFHLYYENSFQLFVNKKIIIYTKDNLTEIFYDLKNKIYNMLMQVAVKKKFKEVVFYLEVQRYSENHLRKKKVSL
jgi:hypothetical protein